MNETPYESSETFQGGMADLTEHGVIQLIRLGNIEFEKNDLSQAGVIFERCLKICQAKDDKEGVHACISNLGRVAEKLGDNERALGYFREALQLANDLGDLQKIANSTMNLGMPTVNTGDFSAARNLYRQARVHYRKLKDQAGLGKTFHNEGLIDLRTGHARTALILFRKALGIFAELNAPYETHGVIVELALALPAAQRQTAIRLLGFAEGLREGRGIVDASLDKWTAPIVYSRTVLGLFSLPRLAKIFHRPAGGELRRRPVLQTVV